MIKNNTIFNKKKLDLRNEVDCFFVVAFFFFFTKNSFKFWISTFFIFQYGPVLYIFLYYIFFFFVMFDFSIEVYFMHDNSMNFFLT